MDTQSKKHNSGIVHVYTREDITLEGGSSSDSFLPYIPNRRQFYFRRWAGLLALVRPNPNASPPFDKPQISVPFECGGWTELALVFCYCSEQYVFDVTVNA